MCKVNHAIDTDQIRMEKQDSVAGNIRHAIPVEWVEFINDGHVLLDKTADKAQRQWHSI